MFEGWERQRYGMTDEQYYRWRKLLYGSSRDWPVEFAAYLAQHLPVRSFRKVAANWVKEHPDGITCRELEDRVR